MAKCQRLFSASWTIAASLCLLIWAMLPFTAAAAKLHSVIGKQKITLTIPTSTNPSFSVFRLRAPARLVFEFANKRGLALSSSSTPQLTLTRGPLQAVEVQEIQGRKRLCLYLLREEEWSIKMRPRSLTLVLFSSQPIPPAPLVAAVVKRKPPPKPTKPPTPPKPPRTPWLALWRQWPPHIETQPATSTKDQTPDQALSTLAAQEARTQRVLLSSWSLQQKQLAGAMLQRGTSTPTSINQDRSTRQEQRIAASELLERARFQRWFPPLLPQAVGDQTSTSQTPLMMPSTSSASHEARLARVLQERYKMHTRKWLQSQDRRQERRPLSASLPPSTRAAQGHWRSQHQALVDGLQKQKQTNATRAPKVSQTPPVTLPPRPALRPRQPVRAKPRLVVSARPRPLPVKPTPITRSVPARPVPVASPRPRPIPKPPSRPRLRPQPKLRPQPRPVQVAPRRRPFPRPMPRMRRQVAMLVPKPKRATPSKPKTPPPAFPKRRTPPIRESGPPPTMMDVLNQLVPGANGKAKKRKGSLSQSQGTLDSARFKQGYSRDLLVLSASFVGTPSFRYQRRAPSSTQTPAVVLDITGLQVQNGALFRTIDTRLFHSYIKEIKITSKGPRQVRIIFLLRRGLNPTIRQNASELEISFPRP